MPDVALPQAPSCETCVSALTRALCKDCLGRSMPFAYKNWTPGDPDAELLKLERSGELNIVIGGEGEAEVNVTWSSSRAAQKLSRVAEMCGYLLARSKDMRRLALCCPHGEFVLVYNDDLKRLSQILRAYHDREPTVIWSAA